MRKFQFTFNERQITRNQQNVGIRAENQTVAAFLVDMFLVENNVDDINFASVKLEEVFKDSFVWN